MNELVNAIAIPTCVKVSMPLLHIIKLSRNSSCGSEMSPSIYFIGYERKTSYRDIPFHTFDFLLVAASSHHAGNHEPQPAKQNGVGKVN